MTDKAFITPTVLKWARESAKMSLGAAADKVSVPVEKMMEWENGTSQPTIRQAQILAKSYKRPFALFFLPEIPRDFQPLQDFRAKGSTALTTASIFIIREIQQKQAWARELNEENNEIPLSFVGRYSVHDDPKRVAADILETLAIKPGHYESGNPIKEWINAAETAGIYISRSSFIHTRLKLDADEFQGFAIADPYAPFVFINSDDWNAPQLFTLVHELAHVWIAESGISNVIEPEPKQKDKYFPVELFCNEVAANVLLPENLINTLPQKTLKSSSEVFNSARQFGVSSFAFLVRALYLNRISPGEYQQLKRQANQEFILFLKKDEDRIAKQKGNATNRGPSPYLLRVNRNSRLFTRTVLDLFHGGYVEPTLASQLLNTKTNKFQFLEAQLLK